MPSAHDMHLLSGPVSWCTECQEQRAADEAEAARANLADMDRLTCDFANKVNEAKQAVWLAHQAVTELISDMVYDIEMAEGPGGDALHELDVAARALRNAERIAKWRRDLMLQVDMSAASTS